MFKASILDVMWGGVLLVLCVAGCYSNVGDDTIDALTADPLKLSDSRSRPLKGVEGRLARAPLHVEGQPASNPVRLHVVADGRRLLGWISGQAPLGKGSVEIHLDGRLAVDAPIRADRTFEWGYDIVEATGAEVVYGDLSYRVSLTPPSVTAAAAYIVVDRTLYRPEQPMHFVAWVRKPSRAGGFEPVADQDVEVLLQSDSATFRLRVKEPDPQ